MRVRHLLWAALAVALVATAPSQAKVPGGCPVTVGNGYVPLGAPTTFYGNGRLATNAYGTITEAPQADGSIWMKYMWFGIREPRKPLKIVGRRLEALTPLTALRVHEGFVTNVNEGYVEGLSPALRFWASGVSFPSEGCWRVTGIVGRVRLSVVVLVQSP